MCIPHFGVYTANKSVLHSYTLRVMPSTLRQTVDLDQCRQIAVIGIGSCLERSSNHCREQSHGQVHVSENAQCVFNVAPCKRAVRPADESCQLRKMCEYHVTSIPPLHHLLALQSGNHLHNRRYHRPQVSYSTPQDPHRPEATRTGRKGSPCTHLPSCNPRYG